MRERERESFPFLSLRISFSAELLSALTHIRSLLLHDSSKYRRAFLSHSGWKGSPETTATHSRAHRRLPASLMEKKAKKKGLFYYWNHFPFLLKFNPSFLFFGLEGMDMDVRGKKRPIFHADIFFFFACWECIRFLSPFFLSSLFLFFSLRGFFRFSVLQFSQSHSRAERGGWMVDGRTNEWMRRKWNISRTFFVVVVRVLLRFFLFLFRSAAKRTAFIMNPRPHCKPITLSAALDFGSSHLHFLTLVNEWMNRWINNSKGDNFNFQRRQREIDFSSRNKVNSIFTTYSTSSVPSVTRKREKVSLSLYSLPKHTCHHQWQSVHLFFDCAYI